MVSLWRCCVISWRCCAIVAQRQIYLRYLLKVKTRLCPSYEPGGSDTSSLTGLVIQPMGRDNLGPGKNWKGVIWIIYLPSVLTRRSAHARARARPRAHAHTHTHTHTHTHNTHMHIHTQNALMHIHTHTTRPCTYTHTHTHTDAHMHTHTHRRAHVHTHTHTQARTCTHTEANLPLTPSYIKNFCF